ncbi:hypothetical protein PGTUg99_033510 [Puccinia graminis f. sp. tritici]|uniref:Uncharacterized protein n=1 Tax=Puccinia graminis f. sp. tritici TaxID=56615 RepID=A0A5B0RMV3_PUCGR|nr:hypothetical protein PGTUg99_033510 [Puccinia graminis f. sp. tritici]
MDHHYVQIPTQEPNGKIVHLNPSELTLSPKKHTFTYTLKSEMPLICWIGIIWLVSSSSTAAPMNPDKRSFLASISGPKLALIPEPMMASRAPAILETSKASYSTAQTATVKASTLPEIANPRLTKSKSLPNKPTSGSQSLSLEIPEKHPVSEPQSPSLQPSKDSVVAKTEKFDAEKLTSSQSQKPTSKIPEISKPEPPDKLGRLSFSGRLKGFLKRKKFKTMKSNSLAIIYLFKSLMEKMKLYSPRRYGSQELVTQVARKGRKALKVKKPPPAPREKMVNENEKAKTIPSRDKSTELADSHEKEKDLAHEKAQSSMYPSSWRNLMGVPSNIYNSLLDTIKTRFPYRLTVSRTPEPTSQALVTVPKPTDSKTTSSASELSHPEEKSGKELSVVKLDHSKEETTLSQESDLSSIDKKQVAQAELTSLVNGILQPIVSRYLTPEKTTKLVDKSVRNKNVALRWVVNHVPTKFSNYFVREKIAPSFVKGFASWAAKTIMKFSSDHIFEVLQRHSIEFLAAINKANAHAAPHPT